MSIQSKLGGSNETERVYTIQEVATILKVTPYTVYSLLRKGRLEGFRLVRRWRITKSSVDKLISKGT